jgi:hypothetical protein
MEGTEWRGKGRVILVATVVYPSLFYRRSREELKNDVELIGRKYVVFNYATEVRGVLFLAVELS